MTIDILLTLDVENDGVSVYNERNCLSWNGVANVVKIKKLIDIYNMKATWFVRADNQLKDIYGTSAYPLKKYKALWEDLANAGDEIAWHPHLYNWVEEEKKYTVETTNVRRVEKLKRIYVELREEGFDFLSVRIGEAFHSNEMMKTLSDLGLRIDSTAIPGRKRIDTERSFDWQPTPNEPYYPSVKDYRIPCKNKHGCLSILEVPITTIPIKTSYDKRFLKRYVNLTFHHALIKAGIDRYFSEIKPKKKSQRFLTLIFHPDEIDEKPRSHPLYSFSLAEVQRNIEYILRQCSDHGFKYRFLRMRDILSYYEGRN